VRKAEASKGGDLVEAMGWALSAVAEEDAKGFFGHCANPLGAPPS
jgi:hypothetical protein